MAIRVQDPALQAALFLQRHPGWSPDDLERADPDVIELMRAIDLTAAQAQKRGS